MNHNDEFETLAAVHAVGALDGDDLARLLAHLDTGCAECDRVLRESEEALARESLGGVRAIPPAHVWSTRSTFCRPSGVRTASSGARVSP